METKPITFGLGSNLDVDDMTVGDTQSVAFYNCYVDRLGSIHRWPGLAEELDLGTNLPVHFYYSKVHDALILVSGGKVWGLHQAGGTPVSITGATLTPGSRPTFVDDGSTVYLAANSPIYYFDTHTSLKAVTGNPPSDCWTMTWAFGYLLANGNELPADTTYSNDDTNLYAQWLVYNNEAAPDVLQSLITLNNQYIYNIGRDHIEVTYQSGDSNNPWAVNPSRIFSIGTIARYSPAYDGQDIFMLSEITGARKVLVFPAGCSPTIVSFPVDVPIENFEKVDDAEGYLMAFKGQNFYVLHFPTANTVINDGLMADVTLAYHIQAKAWYILAGWDTDNGVWKAWRGVDYTYVEHWGKQYVGGNDGKLYTFCDALPPDYDSANLIKHRWRNDGNKTWSHPRAISLGAAGQYTRPSEQRQCGIYHSRQHELSYTDLSDAGEMFRMSIMSGNVNHGTVSKGKMNHRYIYNVKRGTNDLVIDRMGIEEDFEFLRR